MSAVAPVAFTIIFVVWVVYSIILAYHWIRYGHESWLMVPALVTHVFVSACIILFIMSALR